MDINSLGKVSNKVLPSVNRTQDSNVNNNFGNFLVQSLNDLNKLEIEANEYKTQLITGEIENIHELMIATEKANISLQLTLAVRNKIVDAYREIMRMQI